MGHHRHLTLEQREMIMAFRIQGKTIAETARLIGKDKSTVSRELRRNSDASGAYMACRAEREYRKRRGRCHRRQKLLDDRMFRAVRRLFVEMRWSPEQISERMRLEGFGSISANTIYRAIYRHMFDAGHVSHGGRGLIRHLRHKGRKRHRKGDVETRGKIHISHLIYERPQSANDRAEIGHWEGDTVLGRKGRACLVTMVDRKSRFLICRKASGKTSAAVGGCIRDMFSGHPLLSITPDRGKEFSSHEEISAELGVDFYFPLPRHPWDRGTNENTNGLLREYYPKGKDITDVGDDEISSVMYQLNTRPRKCLGFRTPYEVYYSEKLHLI